jgi:hypothetical protein
MKGHFVSDETKEKLSNAHKGKVLSDEHKLRISNSLRERWSDGEFDDVHVGENSILWRGGTDKPYPKEFNEGLKEIIRDRDEYKCRICLSSQGERAFPVHHIDGDKNNNKHENLITLCLSCHGHVHGTYKTSDPVILAFRSMLQ